MEITTLAHQSWNAYQKIAFRFFCCLFLIYLFPFPIDSLPFVNELLSIHPKLSEWFGAPFEKYTEFWHAVIPWDLPLRLPFLPMEAEIQPMIMYSS